MCSSGQAGVTPTRSIVSASSGRSVRGSITSLADGNESPDAPRDPAVLATKAEMHRYAAALARTGFAGPCAWYMNHAANQAYAAAAPAGGRLAMPVLFLHAAHDQVCETIDSRLAEPMRRDCADLTEATVASGHWMAQEKPAAVNAALARWLATRLPEVWPGA